MKWILGLLIGMLIASPAFAQLTRDEAETLLTGFARLTAKVEKISEELVTVKTDIAVLKTELRNTKTELKNYVDLKFDALNREQAERDKRVETEIRGLTRQLSFVQFLLGILVTGLLAVLLGLLKQQWDKRKADGEKLGAQQKELTEKEKALAEKQSEIDALRAEVERIKNTSGLVSPTGGRLEDEVKGGSS